MTLSKAEYELQFPKKPPKISKKERKAIAKSQAEAEHAAAQAEISNKKKLEEMELQQDAQKDAGSYPLPKLPHHVPSSRFHVGYSETIGHRQAMEDSILLHGRFRGSVHEDIFGVFDGHGGSNVRLLLSPPPCRFPRFLFYSLTSFYRFFDPFLVLSSQFHVPRSRATPPKPSCQSLPSVWPCAGVTSTAPCRSHTARLTRT